MNNLELAARLVEALIWPIATLIIASLYKPQVVAIIATLRSLKVAGAEATFEGNIKAAEDKSKLIEPVPSDLARNNDKRLSQLLGMASISPTGAVVEAWKDVEETAWQLFKQSEFAPRTATKFNNLKNNINLLRLFSQYNLLPKAELEILQYLRVLRNQAAHSSNEAVPVLQAIQYVKLADKLVDVMKASISS